ncbi:hypothetical protein H4R20_005738, partial [Coemansia guatemalensis]
LAASPPPFSQTSYTERSSVAASHNASAGRGARSRPRHSLSSAVVERDPFDFGPRRAMTSAPRPLPAVVSRDAAVRRPDVRNVFSSRQNPPPRQSAYTTPTAASRRLSAQPALAQPPNNPSERPTLRHLIGAKITEIRSRILTP